MKVYDGTMQELKQHYDKCWRCGTTIENYKYQVGARAKCDLCGFIVETTTTRNVLINLVWACAFLAGMVGFIVGQIL